MWFYRKRKNNRRERPRHVLDVKLRSTERRKLFARRSALMVGLPVCLLIGFYGMWCGGQMAIEQFIERNPAFAIHRIDIQTDGVLSQEQIRRWAGVNVQDNLFALDLARVKRDLELVPNIQNAAVERVLPHCLKIRVVEREPVAQLQFASIGADGAAQTKVLYVDSQGWVLPPLEPSQRAMPATAEALAYVPVLTGVPARNVRVGQPIAHPHVRTALSLIETFDHSPMGPLADLKEIDLSQPQALAATTAQGTTLTLGLNDLAAQMRRWHAVFNYGRSNSKHIAWIDLSVANNVPARWLDTAALPSPPPKAVKPPRQKKKHV